MKTEQDKISIHRVTNLSNIDRSSFLVARSSYLVVRTS